jgi:hypothetical protein
MIGKFAYRYGVYSCTSKNPLYCYRRWGKQMTSGGTELWSQLYVNEYRYQQYVNRKYHRFFLNYWDRIAAYLVLKKCEDMNKSYYHLTINIDNIINVLKLPSDILTNEKRVKRDKFWLDVYMDILNRKWEDLGEHILFFFTH